MYTVGGSMWHSKEAEQPNEAPSPFRGMQLHCQHAGTSRLRSWPTYKPLVIRALHTMLCYCGRSRFKRWH